MPFLEDKAEPLTPSIDWSILAELDELSFSDPSFSKEIIQIFQLKSTDRIRALQLAIDSNNLEDIMQEAHALKSASCCVGAIRLQQYCDEIRVFAKKSNLQEILNLMNQLRDELKMVFVLLDQELARQS